MRKRIAAGDSDSAEFLLHACRQAQGARDQRAQRQCAQDGWRIQGVARPGLRLLFDQTLAACQADKKRRQELSDRAAVDDQPLMYHGRGRPEQIDAAAEPPTLAWT